MSYPTIPYEEARSWWNRWKGAQEGESEPEHPPSVEERKVGFPRDWRSEASDLVVELLDLLDGLGEGGGRDRFARFEAEAAVRIHRTLPRDHPALADPEFWIWYAVDPGLSLVRARYRGKTVPDVANFASSNARETLFYRLWLRGEMGCRPHEADPHRLARYGDVDFWRSHVFRQMYAEYPPLLEAFVCFQYPEGPDGPPRIALSENQRELRKFVKRMKRIGTNVMVEFLDVDTALSIMEGEWNRLRQEEMA
jgi:hypothetical protein